VKFGVLNTTVSNLLKLGCKTAYVKKKCHQTECALVLLVSATIVLVTVLDNGP
jgi:hypothetical protein